MCVDEAPENVHVVGATNSSIVIELAGTASVVGLLVFIYRQLSYVVKDCLVIADEMENLRHKRILYDEVEKIYKEKMKNISDDGVKSAVDEVKKNLPKKIEGDKATALTKAIEKFFNFYEKGGAVDFVAPPQEEADDESGKESVSQELSDLREMIEEIRSVQNEIKLLTHERRDEEK
jgi:hypothetical protein